MRIVTYSEARQNLAKLLVLAQSEEVEIRRKDGSVFSLRSKRKSAKSPFDLPGLNTDTSTADILKSIHESRNR